MWASARTNPSRADTPGNTPAEARHQFMSDSVKLPGMRKLALSSWLVFVALCAGPKQRPWQDATVVKIGHSAVETQETEYTPSPSAAGVTSSAITTRRTKIWTYAFKTDRQLYVGKIERKPVGSLKEGDRIRIAVYRGVLYVLTPDTKEHRLELFNEETH